MSRIVKIPTTGSDAERLKKASSTAVKKVNVNGTPAPAQMRLKPRRN